MPERSAAVAAWQSAIRAEDSALDVTSGMSTGPESLAPLEYRLSARQLDGGRRSISPVSSLQRLPERLEGSDMMTDPRGAKVTETMRCVVPATPMGASSSNQAGPSGENHGKLQDAISTNHEDRTDIVVATDIPTSDGRQQSAVCYHLPDTAVVTDLDLAGVDSCQAADLAALRRELFLTMNQLDTQRQSTATLQRTVDNQAVIKAQLEGELRHVQRDTESKGIDEQRRQNLREQMLQRLGQEREVQMMELEVNMRVIEGLESRLASRLDR